MLFLQIAPVSCQLGEKVLKNRAARLSKPHRPDMSVRRYQNSQSEKKLGKFILSPNDPPMPSKAVKELNGKRKRDDKQVQSVEHGENLVGERIKVWWPEDKKYYEGVVESFDCGKKKHKVSYDDGEVERLDLKGEQWELVKKLSPPSDSSVRRYQNSQSEKKLGKFILSPNDPSMPSKAVKELNGKRKRDDKQVQSVEHGENLVGERIKVWWPEDKKYYEGVVESFDCGKKKHKVSYDDGEVERLDLKGEQWELVKKLSPPSDSSVRRCQNSQSEKKLGKFILSSNDPPMPSKAVKELNGKRKRDDKQVQSVEHGENLVGERIKVWWPEDKKYYEGVVESFDCGKKKHKVSYDDGYVERLDLKDLKGEQWELVKKVSPPSDSLAVELPIIVSSPQSGVTCVQGYTVKNINAPILESIFKKHGDIAAKCVFKTSSARESILEVVCEVVRKFQTNDVTAIISDMEEIDSQVSGAEAIKINVAWLRVHLEAIHKRTEAKKKCSLLMKMNANTSLVTIAAEMDLKEILSELTTVQERFEKAKRCVEVLNIVKKQLKDSFLESKAETDSWVEQPIL